MVGKLQAKAYFLSATSPSNNPTNPLSYSPYAFACVLELYLSRARPIAAVLTNAGKIAIFVFLGLPREIQKKRKEVSICVIVHLHTVKLKRWLACVQAVRHIKNSPLKIF